MRRFATISLVLTFAYAVQASWYWPFGSDEVESSEPRISELMEPASLLIDEATDLAEDGKTDEAVEKYRKALAELDRIEMENPERAKSAEFATLRNKRAYVNAAIDTMLLGQIKTNAKAVAVSDTAELEKKLAEERAAKKAKETAEVEQKDGDDVDNAAEPSAEENTVKDEAEERIEKDEFAQVEAERQDTPKPPKVKGRNGKSKRQAAAQQTPGRRPVTKRDQAIDCIAHGDFTTAERIVEELLAAKPNSAMALNLKATMQVKQGKLKEAEETLDQAIASNPRSYYAYYNMAFILLKKGADAKPGAKRFYETGRAMGGPVDSGLEALLK